VAAGAGAGADEIGLLGREQTGDEHCATVEK
jgi:hypothetical protein